MSRLLNKVSDFLKLVLSTGVRQGKVLLTSASNIQVKALAEIAYNLLSLPLPAKLDRVVKKYCRILKKVSDKTTKLTEKLKIIARNVSKILLCLKASKKIILDLIRK